MSSKIKDPSKLKTKSMLKAETKTIKNKKIINIKAIKIYTGKVKPWISAQQTEKITKNMTILQIKKAHQIIINIFMQKSQI